MIKINWKTILLLCMFTVVGIFSLSVTSAQAEIQIVTATTPPVLTVNTTSTPTPTPLLPLTTIVSMENILATYTPLPEVSTYNNTTIFSFKDLNQSDFVLHFPEAIAFDINLPDQWIIANSSSDITIHYSLQENEQRRLAAQSLYDRYRYGVDRPLVEVYFNEFLAGTFAPEVGGNQTAQIKFPYQLMAARNWNTQNAYTISINYYNGADVYCDYDGILTIYNDSTVNLVFEKSPAVLNLANFPKPIIQDSIIPETLLIIVPDDYNENDLSAAAEIIVAIGRSTYGNVKFNIIKPSEVTSTLLASSSAVVIGPPGRNTFLHKLYVNKTLITDLDSNGNISGIAPDDGLLLLAYSEVNKVNSYLVITGNNDIGVKRAAEAIIRPPVGLSGVLFIARTDFAPPTPNPTPPDTYLFSDLDFGASAFYGLGEQIRYISFYVPRNWIIQDNAKLVVNYSYANNISFTNSVVTVNLNNVPISTLPLEPGSIGEQQVIIPLKRENILLGTVNTVRFDLLLAKELDCSIIEPNTSWMNIRDTSLIYLPYQINTQVKDLMSFLHPFYYLASEPDILISLPPKPTSDELRGMSNSSFNLGSQLRRQPNFNIQVSLNPQLDTTAYKDFNLLIIGKPTRNPMIATINNNLPQPFVPGEDSLALQQQIAQYRIEPGVGLGIVQVLAAPWNPLRGITVVTGTSDEGLAWVINQIAKPDLIYNISGNLSFIQQDKIQSYKSGVPTYILPSILSGITGQTASLETVQPTGAATVSAIPDQYVRKVTTTSNMGLPIMLGLVALAIIIAIIAVIRMYRGGRIR